MHLIDIINSCSLVNILDERFFNRQTEFLSKILIALDIMAGRFLSTAVKQYHKFLRL